MKFMYTTINSWLTVFANSVLYILILSQAAAALIAFPKLCKLLKLGSTRSTPGSTDGLLFNDPKNSL